MKYYQPSSGTLLIDGQPLQTLDLEWLRNNVTLVQQESVLFNDTMFQNIALGRRQHYLVTKEDVKMACQTAMLQETINDLPEGLDTMIGSGGNSMSGGQKQRVAIARARLRDSPILILDEATSALDHVSRSLVMEAIRSWRKGKTTIIITHDVSEILPSDYVYVLDRGQVVQEGYSNMLAADEDGLFASFVPATSESRESQAIDQPLEKVLSNRTSLSAVRRSRSASFSSAVSGYGWTDREGLSRRRTVSRFFGLDNEVLKKARSNQRSARGMGIAHVYANTFRTENMWEGLTSPLTTRPYQIMVDKPLPALPGTWGVQRAHSVQHLSRAKPKIIELSDLKKTNPTPSRTDTLSSRRSPEYHTERQISTSSDVAPLITRKRLPIQLENGQRVTPNVYNRTLPLKHILGTVWPNLLWEDQIILLLGFVCAFISAASTPAFSYVLARLLSTFNMTFGQLQEAQKWALYILGIAIVDGAATYYMHYLLEYCGQTWVDTLRVEALKRILAQPKAWFDKEKNNPGRLNECLDRNAEEMRNVVGRFAGYCFLAASMMSIAIVWAFIVCWKLTFVGLASAPFMYAFTRAFESVSGKWEKRLNEMSEQTASIFNETFSNIRVVRALTLENYFKQKHTDASNKAYNVGMHRAAYTGLFFGMSDSTNSFVTALILYYGAVIASSGAWSVESILLVITLLLFSSGNANSVVAFIPQISSSRTTASYMLYLANMPRKASHESYGAKYLPTPLPVELNSLSFTYPSRPTIKILHNVSMVFEAGSCTAIVGSSGSGKSTIATLLLGLYPPAEPLHYHKPTLTFNGSSIFTCNIPFLRSQIALVSQAPVLFPSTVAENITYGLRETSEYRSTHNLHAAAREAGIHDFIMSLPQGYETKIGDGGMGISGGQAQRICIARALIRRPQILILDEPTSALDYESAEIIRQTIDRLVSRKEAVGLELRDLRARGGRGETAVIIITHSLEMMKVAEKIVVLDQGRVVEEGGFEELRKRKGAFSKLISGGEWLGDRDG